MQKEWPPAPIRDPEEKRKLTFTLPSHNLPLLSNLFSLASLSLPGLVMGKKGQEMKRRREKSKSRPGRRARIDLEGEQE